MDVYHKILVKLYEVTGGRDSKKVDFAELLKKEGFYPSYADIFKTVESVRVGLRKPDALML